MLSPPPLNLLSSLFGSLPSPLLASFFRCAQFHHQQQHQELLQHHQRQQQLLLQRHQQAQASSQQQQKQQLQQNAGLQIASVSAALESAAPMLSQQLTTLGNSDVAKAAKPASSDAAGSDSENLERSLQQMSQVLEEAKEFLKKQKKPFRADGSRRNAQSEQDEQDLNWISCDDFSGANKGKRLTPPPPTAADMKLLAECNTFKSAFGSRGQPFTLLSSEYLLPSTKLKQPEPLAVTDKDLKYIVLLLMQETLYAGMLQDWEHLLGGGNSLKLLQETLSIFSLGQDLSQSDLKTILRIKESGQGEAWKRIWGTLHESLGCPSKSLLSFLHTALRLAVERRYILSSEHRERVAKTGHLFPQELGGDWAKLRMFLSRTLANQEAGFAAEQNSGNQDLSTGVIKSCIIIARFLGDSGQFREADVLFDRARILAVMGSNKIFCAEVSLYCAELLNKWSASDPSYSVDTMARSAEYACLAAQLYESIEVQGDTEEHNAHMVRRVCARVCVRVARDDACALMHTVQ